MEEKLHDTQGAQNILSTSAEHIPVQEGKPFPDHKPENKSPASIYIDKDNKMCGL